MSTRRQLRVAELIRQELSNLITLDLRDPRLALISVTRVQVSPDLRHANAFISSLEGEEGRAETLAALRHAQGFLRRELGRRTDLRYVPELAFHFDDGLIQSQRMSDLLDEIAEQAPAVEADAAG
ncbi:MAG TPA: 30S ribosome-binding factor RbfA [Anaerolineae bacterium]|nr:30S ribosome-binding factor RbfA [Anaerolineae bacterium]